MEDEKIQHAKNDRLNEQKNRKRERWGKVRMTRSLKPSIKKVEAPKEIDPEKLAFMQYLGVLDEEDEGAKDAAGSQQ